MLVMKLLGFLFPLSFFMLFRYLSIMEIFFDDRNSLLIT